MSGIEPDTEGISSIESSSYCVFSVPSELSEDYALFTEIRDGHQVLHNTQIGNKQKENNKGFMEPKNGSLTEMSLHDKTPLGGSGSYAEIDSTRGTDETDYTNLYRPNPHHHEIDQTDVKKPHDEDNTDPKDYTNLFRPNPHHHEIDQTDVKKPYDEDNTDPKGYTNLFRPHPHHHDIDQTDVKKPHDEDNTDPNDYTNPYSLHPHNQDIDQTAVKTPHDEDNTDPNDYANPYSLHPHDHEIDQTDMKTPHDEDNTDPNWRRIKPVVLVVFICLSVSAAVAFIVVNKNVDDPVPTSFPPSPDPPSPPPPPPPPEYLVSPGDRICVHYDDLHNTSRISHITMQQTSSAYFYNLFQFNMSVNSTVSNFTRYVDDWIVDYDILRIEQMLRLVQPKAYCSSPGKYSVILEYTDAFHTSFEFEVRMKDPQLNQSITSEDQGIHVQCELTGTCLPSSLAIYVTVNNSKLLVPDTNACSYNDRKTGTMVSIQATIPFSMITKNQSISCVPLMRNQELAENLTNTIPTCDEPDCKPNCKNGSNTGMYYPNSVYCDKFYHCSNGAAIEQDCANGTYWEPTKCGCDHYNTTICDMNNNTRITPLRTLNPCG